jgi:hypothetical protein
VIRRVRKKARSTLRKTLRGVAFVALAAKFLVPVGYMPASLADGGPIRLCESGPVLGTPSAASSPHASHAQHTHSSSHAGDSGSLNDPAAAGEHDHDDSSAGHHDWERCSLGGLAAIAGEWQIAVATLPPARIAVAASTSFSRQTVVPFRSRAPPLALS